MVPVHRRCKGTNTPTISFLWCICKGVLHAPPFHFLAKRRGISFTPLGFEDALGPGASCFAQKRRSETLGRSAIHLRSKKAAWLCTWNIEDVAKVQVQRTVGRAEKMMMHLVFFVLCIKNASPFLHLLHLVQSNTWSHPPLHAPAYAPRNPSSIFFFTSKMYNRRCIVCKRMRYTFAYAPKE